MHLLTGNRDALNSLPLMEAYVRGAAGGQVTTTVVDGDHGLQVSRRKEAASQAANAANIEGAVVKVVSWLEGLSRPWNMGTSPAVALPPQQIR